MCYKWLGDAFYPQINKLLGRSPMLGLFYKLTKI